MKRIKEAIRRWFVKHILGPVHPGTKYGFLDEMDSHRTDRRP